MGDRSGVRTEQPWHRFGERAIQARSSSRGTVSCAWMPGPEADQRPSDLSVILRVLRMPWSTMTP
jgi:hypothetical protein